MHFFGSRIHACLFFQSIHKFVANYFLSAIMANIYFQMVTGTGAVNRDGKNLEQRKFIQDLRVQISYSN